MNFIEVKELISILDDSKLAYFELENEDGYISVFKYNKEGKKEL